MNRLVTGIVGAIVWALTAACAVAQVPHSFVGQQGYVSAQQLDDNFLYNRGTVYPMDAPYNCVGDGVADDTTCFQAALTASQGKALRLGPHCYKISKNLTFSGPVHVFGVGAGWDSVSWDKSSCLVAGAANVLFFQLYSGSTLKDFAILAGGINPSSPTITNASGKYAIGIGSVSSVRIEGLWIDHACIAIDLNGDAQVVDKTYISKVGGSGCEGVRVGNFTTGAGSVDNRIMNTTIQGDQSNPPDANLLVLDAGGLFLDHDDFLYGTIGTKITPGANQQVIWLYADGTALGDTTVNQGIYINPTASSAQIKGLNFTDSWASSTSSGDEISILNTASATKVTDFNFTGFRAYGMPGNGITVGSGVLNVAIGGASDFCGYGGNGVNLQSGVTNFSLVGSRVSPTCAGLSGAGTVAISFGGSNSAVTVTGNDFTGNTGFITGTPTGASVMGSNNGIDTAVATFATAATVTLGSRPIAHLTGTTGVSTINGFWNGRVVTLITTSGAVAFSTGGNICNALTSTQNVPVQATYDATSACWYLK